jgi:hypothetical protein
MSTETLPKPEEVELKIQLYKEILEQISAFLNEKIASLEEAKRALIRAEEVGGIKFELPAKKPGQERLYAWLKAKLEEQQDKGHIRDLNITVSGEKTLYSFKLLKKDDEKAIRGWFNWVRKKLK